MKGSICFSGRTTSKIHRNFAGTILREQAKRKGQDPSKVKVRAGQQKQK